MALFGEGKALQLSNGFNAQGALAVTLRETLAGEDVAKAVECVLYRHDAEALRAELDRLLEDDREDLICTQRRIIKALLDALELCA